MGEKGVTVNDTTTIRELFEGEQDPDELQVIDTTQIRRAARGSRLVVMSPEEALELAVAIERLQGGLITALTWCRRMAEDVPVPDLLAGDSFATALFQGERSTLRAAAAEVRTAILGGGR